MFRRAKTNKPKVLCSAGSLLCRRGPVNSLSLEKSTESSQAGAGRLFREGNDGRAVSRRVTPPRRGVCGLPRWAEDGTSHRDYAAKGSEIELDLDAGGRGGAGGGGKERLYFPGSQNCTSIGRKAMKRRVLPGTAIKPDLAPPSGVRGLRGKTG